VRWQGCVLLRFYAPSFTNPTYRALSRCQERLLVMFDSFPWWGGETMLFGWMAGPLLAAFVFIFSIFFRRALGASAAAPPAGVAMPSTVASRLSSGPAGAAVNASVRNGGVASLDDDEGASGPSQPGQPAVVAAFPASPPSRTGLDGDHWQLPLSARRSASPSPGQFAQETKKTYASPRNPTGANRPEVLRRSRQLEQAQHGWPVACSA